MVNSRLEGANLGIAIIATVATVIGTIAAVLALMDRGGGADTGSDRPQPPASTVSAPASPTGDPARTPTADLLARLTPTLGVTRLTELPDTLRHKADYADSVAIACPSNEVGQKQSEVSYESRGLYRTFAATLEAYRSPAQGVRMQLFVFLDPASRDFGIDDQKSAGQIQLSAGQTGPFSADLKGAYYVRLRLVCEKPGGMLILRQAALSPAA